MKTKTLILSLVIGFQSFGQVDLINKIKDNGADSPLTYEWETVVDIEATHQARAGLMQPLLLWRAR